MSQVKHTDYGWEERWCSSLNYTGKKIFIRCNSEAYFKTESDQSILVIHGSIYLDTFGRKKELIEGKFTHILPGVSYKIITSDRDAMIIQIYSRG